MLYLSICSSNQTNSQEIEFLDRETFKKLGQVQLDTSVILDTSCMPVFNDKDRLCFLDQSAVSVLSLFTYNKILILNTFFFHRTIFLLRVLNQVLGNLLMKFLLY